MSQGGFWILRYCANARTFICKQKSADTGCSQNHVDSPELFTNLYSLVLGSKWKIVTENSNKLLRYFWSQSTGNGGDIGFNDAKKLNEVTFQHSHYAHVN